MDLIVVLLAVTAFPVAGLGFVLWMARLEETIPAAVRRATRLPDPPPVLAVPVRAQAARGAPQPSAGRDSTVREARLNGVAGPRSPVAGASDTSPAPGRGIASRYDRRPRPVRVASPRS